MTTNPKWKMMFYVANTTEIAHEADVTNCDDGVWLQAKASGDGCRVSGNLIVWYVDSDDLEVGDVPSSS